MKSSMILLPTVLFVVLQLQCVSSEFKCTPGANSKECSYHGTCINNECVCDPGYYTYFRDLESVTSERYQCTKHTVHKDDKSTYFDISFLAIGIILVAIGIML